MQLSDYGRILSRWALLIVGGTALGLIVGVGIDVSSRIASGSSTYQDSDSLTINYPAWPYVPGMSFNSAATGLIGHIHDAGALQINPRIPGPAIKSISAVVVPLTSQINVTATAATPESARLAATRGAQYLVHLEDKQVRSATQLTIGPLRERVAQDRKKWLAYDTRLALASALHTSASYRAFLTAKRDYWSQLYGADRGSLSTTLYPGAPPAQAFPPGAGKLVAAKPLSPIKTVIPAALVGLALSFLLAAFLESRLEGERARPALQASTTHSRVPAVGAVNAPQSVRGASLGQEVVENRLGSRSDVLMALADSMSQTGDEVTKLLQSARPSLFVTSPTASEPRADTAVGLAASFGKQGKHVILVDADPAGDVTSFFGLGGRPGLSDFLGYPHGSISRLLYSTGAKSTNGHLAILPYGIHSSDSVILIPETAAEGELEAWATGLAQLTHTADVIVVCGPSVLDSSLPASVSAMGGAVVVIKSERNEADLNRASDVLRSEGVRVLGMVVNPGPVKLSTQKWPPSTDNPDAHPISVME